MSTDTDLTHPESFCGSWRVDQSQSDSIEPMLQSMGVSLVVRKMAQSVKVVQKIAVEDNQFIVMNISNYAEDKTVHYMNVGQRVILTPKGEKVLDTCTFNPNREFPIQIQAVLPGGKGETEDKRKLLPDSNSFIQHLTFFPPPRANGDKPKPILMKRLFVRVTDKKKKSIKAKAPAVKNGEAKKKEDDKSLQKVHPQATEAQQKQKPKPMPKTSVAVPTKQMTVTETETELKASSSKSGTMWVFTSLSAMGLILLVVLVNNELVSTSEATPAGIVLTMFLVYSRVSITMGSDDISSMSWVFVVLSVLVLFFIDSYLELADLQNSFAKFSIGYAVMVYVISRYFALSTDKSGEVTAFFSLDDHIKYMEAKTRWALLGSVFVACTISFGSVDLKSLSDVDISNKQQISLLLLIFLYLAVRLSMWRVGDEVVEKPHVQTEPSKKEQDLENIVVKIADHRIIDDIYTQYKVVITCDEGVYWVWRRFSQFDTLRTALKKNLGSGVLPKLPSKTFFSNMDPDFLEQRQDELNEFLQQILECEGGKKEMLKLEPLKQFLGLGQGRAAAMESARKEAEKEVKTTKDPSKDPELIQKLIKARIEIEKAASIGEGDGWKFIGKKHGVQCYLKKGIEGHTFTKGVGIVQCPPNVLIGFMSEPENRKKYDEMFKAVTTLHQLDEKLFSEHLNAKVEQAAIQWSEFSSPFPSLVTARDICTLNVRYTEPNTDKIVVLLVSADDYKEPVKKYVRASVTAGVIIEPLPGNPNKCTMTNITMMDPNGNIPQWIINSMAPERCAQSSKVDQLVKDRSVWEKYQ